jgi:hypothetical protein
MASHAIALSAMDGVITVRRCVTSYNSSIRAVAVIASHRVALSLF